MVVINGTEIKPSFAGLAPGAVGLYQIDLQLPESIAAGSEVPLSLKLRLADGTEILSNATTITVAADAARGRR